MFSKNSNPNTFLKNKIKKQSFFSKILKLLSSEKTILICKENCISEYKVNFTARLIITTLVFGILLWSAFITYAYFANFNSLRSDDKLIAEYKEKYNKVMGQVSAYKDAISEVNEKRELQYRKLVSLLEKNKSITDTEKNKYLKEQSLASAEMLLISAELEDFINNTSLRKVDIDDQYYKMTRAELQRDVAWQERKKMNKTNEELIKLSLEVKEAQMKLLDKVEILAKSGLGDIEKTLSKLDRSFSQIGLISKKILLNKAKKIDEGFGGPFIPIEKVKLTDSELDARYTEVNKQVDMWDGLTKVHSILPIGYPLTESKTITSGYGEREDPFLKVPAFHKGIDFRGKIGTGLYVTAPGKVIRAKNLPDYGLMVEVEHWLGFTTLYAHLSKILVSEGDFVNTGDKVGLAGSTGRSTGPHLHYEVRYNGRAINPYSFVKAGE